MFFWNSFRQYEFAYNDYVNKYANFDTDLFRHFFTILLDGWVSHNVENHPLFKNPFDFRFRHESGADGFLSNYPENVIFKNDWISEFLNPWAADSSDYDINDWRILPQPRISENVLKNNVVLYYAVINPNSSNIEDAIFYLESFVKDPHNALLPNFQNFTQRDMRFYWDTYDTNLLVFGDMYDLFKNGFILTIPSPNLSNQFIDDYQRGRLTLDEVIDVLQREYEMALNE
jgi:hypothetical protein